MLICVKNKLFDSFHNDISCIQLYFNWTKTLILSSFLMSLDSIIFVCKCLVQCDLLRVTEAFSCKRAWQQKSAEWPVSIVNRTSLVQGYGIKIINGSWGCSRWLPSTLFWRKEVAAAWIFSLRKVQENMGKHLHSRKREWTRKPNKLEIFYYQNSLIGGGGIFFGTKIQNVIFHKFQQAFCIFISTDFHGGNFIAFC